ncbi:hypothetical protein JCM19240_2019 [Vibrio maritimus]|uniref:Uncharacterized protein n=1 Tax=Vibrio maritimus TaxID=990268 RepID=A0A090T2B5_9VIBR|nr:hypothetical protein JCM19240_2019 [Vibrio maritimus]
MYENEWIVQIVMYSWLTQVFQGAKRLLSKWADNNFVS